MGVIWFVLVIGAVLVMAKLFGWSGGLARIDALQRRVDTLGSKVDELQRQVTAARSRPEVSTEPATEPATETVPNRPLTPLRGGSQEPSVVKAVAERAMTPTDFILSDEPVTHAAMPSAGNAPDPSGKPKPPARPAPPLPPAAPSRVAKHARHVLLAAIMGGEEKVDWETLIGGRWLNFIGIATLVVGISLFLGYTLRYYGPIGKVATGLGAGLALIATGIFLEKSKIYRLFARPLLGGGWALLYFTAYAAHSVDAARVINSPAGGLAVLFLVAIGIITHSFKYRSQAVTGVAYSLGFLTIAISPVTHFSLVATGILAIVLVGIIRILPWYHLGLVGVAATYMNYLLWQGPGIGGASTLPLNSLLLNLGILTFYWSVFVATAFVRKPQDETEEQVSLAVNAANTVGFLALSFWQFGAAAPSNLYLLAGFGAIAYAVTAYLAYMTSQRLLFLFNASIAVVLAAVSLPLAVPHTLLPAEALAAMWTIEAAGVLYLGYRLKQIILRVEAYLLCLGAFMSLFAFNLNNFEIDRIGILGLTVPVVIGFFYYLFNRLPKLVGRNDVRPEAQQLGVAFGYAGAAAIAILLWHILPRELVGMAWLATGLLCVEIGIRTTSPHMRGQGYALSAAAFVILSITIFAQGAGRTISGPLPWEAIMIPVITGLYALYWRLDFTGFQALRTESERSWSNTPSYAATFLLGAWLWTEVAAGLIGLAWLGAGLVILEWGIRSGRQCLRIQGYTLAALSLLPLFIVNLYGFYIPPGGIDMARVVVIGPAAAAFYYLYWRISRHSSHGTIDAAEVHFAEYASIAGTALITVLLWRELNAVEVALAWAAFAFALFEFGSRLGNGLIRVQGHVLIMLAFGRLFMANFTAFGEIGGISHRSLTVLPVVAILYYIRAGISVAAVTDRLGMMEARLRPLYSYGAVILLVVLARFELGRVHAVMGWAPLMVILLILGHRLRDRDFRIQSYLLAVLTFARGWASGYALDGSFYGIPERHAVSIPVVVALLAATFIAAWQRRTKTAQTPTPDTGGSKLFRLFDKVERHSTLLFSSLGIGLLTILIYQEVSGNLLTIAWAVEALLLMTVGFVAMERSFRLYGLALLALCMVKLMAIDLAAVDTLYRIVSFIVLGIILLLISVAYTRYRDVITRYL